VYDDGYASFPAILQSTQVRVEPRTRWGTVLLGAEEPNGTQTEWYRFVKMPITSVFFTAFYVRIFIVRKRNGNFLLTHTVDVV